MELRILLGGLRRGFLLVLVLGLAGFAAGVALSSDESLPAAATSVLLDPGEDFIGDPDRYVEGEIAILLSQPVAIAAASSVGTLDAAAVQGAISVSQRAGSNMVDIVATATTSDEAVAIAGAVAGAYIQRHEVTAAPEEQERLAAADLHVLDVQAQIDTATAGLTGTPEDAAAQARVETLRLALDDALRERQDAAAAVREAGTDSTEIIDSAIAVAPGPNRSRFLLPALGAVGGAGIGLLAGIVRVLSAPRLQTRRQAEYLVGRPALAEITISSTGVAPSSFSDFESFERLDELSLGLRRVAAAVAAHPVRNEPRCVAVVDPAGLAGGYHVAAALASVFAADHHRVALIPIGTWTADANEERLGRALARARVANLPAIPETRGIDLGGWEAVYVGSNRAIVKPWGSDAGPLDARRLADLREALAEHVDIVVLALPPVLESPAAASTAGHADDVVLVVPVPDQDEDQLGQVLDMLDGQAGPTVHLVVARKGRRPKPSKAAKAAKAASKPGSPPRR